MKESLPKLPGDHDAEGTKADLIIVQPGAGATTEAVMKICTLALLLGCTDSADAVQTRSGR